MNDIRASIRGCGRLILATGLFILASVAASAQVDAPYVLPIGTRGNCNAAVTANLTGGLTGPIVVNGLATFEWVATSQPGELRPWAELQPRAVSHNGNSPAYGPVTLDLNAAAPAANSRIEAVNEGAAFPASSNLRFNAVVTVASRPGVLYRSINEIVISSQLTQWPHNNAVYSQVGTTDFEDAAHPGVVAFTLSGASVTVTAVAN
jgi:hypothetical protein